MNFISKVYPPPINTTLTSMCVCVCVCVTVYWQQKRRQEGRCVTACYCLDFIFIFTVKMH